MRNWIIGCLVSLVLIVGIIAGCGQQTREEEASKILKIVSRSPALNATGISSTETLSITFNFPIDHQNITTENLFTEYLTDGENHTAGAPDLTSVSLTWSADSKTMTLSGIKGWSSLTQEAGAKVVELLAAEGKIKDIFTQPRMAPSTMSPASMTRLSRNFLPMRSSPCWFGKSSSG